MPRDHLVDGLIVRDLVFLLPDGEGGKRRLSGGRRWRGPRRDRPPGARSVARGKTVCVRVRAARSARALGGWFCWFFFIVIIIFRLVFGFVLVVVVVVIVVIVVIIVVMMIIIICDDYDDSFAVQVGSGGVRPARGGAARPRRGWPRALASLGRED